MTKRSSSPPAPDETAATDMRLLPHDLEAERCVLGCILIDNTMLMKAQQHLKSTDFFRRAHQAVFAAMCHVADNQRAEVDPVTLKAELTRVKALEEVGGPAYIAQLTDGVPRSSNVEHYAKIVRGHSLRRQVIDAGKAMLSEAYDGTIEPEALVTAADKRIVDLLRGASGHDAVDLREAAGALWADLEFRVNNHGKLFGLSTGFPSVDDLTGGWQRGDLIIVAARPSIGKTAFVLNSATKTAQHGKHVYIASLEMKQIQLQYRMLAMLSGVHLTKITRGWLGEQDFERVTTAWDELHELPIHVDDRRSGQTVWTIRATCRRLKSEGKLDLVVIDYVQLVAGSLERRGVNRNEELMDISRRLKILADEVDCPVIVLSQLRRQGKGGSDREPELEDLRDSGALEQDADLVGFLHRKDHRESGVTKFILKKQRQGDAGTVNLTLTRDTQQFEDAGAEPVQPPMEEVPDTPSKPRRYTPPWQRR